MTTFKKILQNDKDIIKLIIAGSGFFIGFFLFLFSLQLFLDFSSLLSEDNRKIQEYLMINKKADLTQAITQEDTLFTPQEIEDIKNQYFTLDIGTVITNKFTIFAMVGFSGGAYGSELFFESVPDRFLDEIPEDWGWSPDSDEIPIIISREFLSLYNFGFSQARNLPIITEDTIGLIAAQIEFTGPQGRLKSRARIVGFSDRIDSILVPYDFIIWANKTLSGVENPNPSRVIVSVKDPSDPGIKSYLNQKGYSTNKEKLKFSDVVKIVQIILVAVAFLGVLILVLSLLTISLTFQLIISNSREHIRLLIQLGYHSDIIIKPLSFANSVILLITTGASFLIYFITTGITHSQTRELGVVISAGINVWVILAGILIMFGGIFLNHIILKKRVAALE